MSGFEFKKTKLEGAYLIGNFHAGDSRGEFTKSFEKDIYACAGIDFSLNETFYSKSAKNVIRGLHFQTLDPQANLVSVAAGSVWDVVVDLRPDSPTFKQWIAEELSSENHLSFYIPRGFAHGFLSLRDDTVMLYQCDGRYDKDTDTGIRFDDPDIAVDWPIDIKDAGVRDRDRAVQSVKEYRR